MARTAARAGQLKLGDFAAHAKVTKGELPRVCLVTSEFVGMFKNGGLGTSMTGLVEFLAARGADVTVLYTGEIEGDPAIWRERYAGAGIRLVLIDEVCPPQTLVGPLPRIGWVRAWQVREALRTMRFDVVHFNDTLGEGCYCFVAKRLGLDFQDTLLVLALHSPTEWILESNGHPSDWLGFSCFTGGEKLSIANTDLLWGPSRYLLNWIADRGYTLPAQVRQQQYVIPTTELFASGPDKVERTAQPPARLPLRKPQEIVFFGRLEERKGIRLFVNAITRIADELARRDVSVVFMGKPSSVNGVHAGRYLAERSGAWPFRWRIESGYDQQAAVRHLKEADCVAVMASPVDNSPCTVYEALQFGFPFIAARTGGIPELIHPDDAESHLFDYTVGSLSSRLLKTLDEGISNARPAVPVAENQARWLGVHRDWRSFMPSRPKPDPVASWSVIVDHAGSAEALAHTLASLDAAFAGKLRQVFVHRRDRAELAALAAHVTVVDELDDTTPGEMLGAADSAGGAVLMIRSGVAVVPDALAALEAGASGPAHLVVPMASVAGRAVMPMLPSSAALTALEGDYDSGAFAFRVGRVEALLGSFGRLDRSRPYFGLLDEVHGARGDVWPLPEVALVARSAQDLVLPLENSEARRSLAMSRMHPLDAYQALAVGRSRYRGTWPATAPEPPAPAPEEAPAPVADAPGPDTAPVEASMVETATPPQPQKSALRIVAIKTAFFVFGSRTPDILRFTRKVIGR
jgi:glycosyltransferase involved in cell wall biosynthesis